MSDVMIRPDLRTSGGEINDILVDGKFAGTLSLVYREGERMSGAVQLEKESLTARKKQMVIDHTRSYVQALIDAYQVNDCDVVVTYSTYDHIIVTDNNLEYITDTPISYDIEEDDIDNYQMGYYELVIVGEGRHTVEYHVYDRYRKWIAEAYMKIYDTDVVGEVHWQHHPTDEEIELVTDLIVSDFDEDMIETFSINMKYDEAAIETIELAHEDLQDGLSEDSEIEFKVVLVRDDGDALTYDIYEQTETGLPLCTATIDLASREVTGFIDFRNVLSEAIRENIAAAVLTELEKERDYDSVSLSMLHHNELIDEIWFEMDQIH